MRILALVTILIGAASFGVCAEMASESLRLQPEFAAEPNGILTLEEALTLTTLHNPQLAAYSWEVRAAGARALQAGLRPNPELSIEVEEVGGSGSRSGFDGAETTVQLSQLIERGGKRDKRRQAAELEQKLADWDFQSQRLDVLTDTAKAFNDLLAAQENLALAEQLLALAETQTAAVRQRVEAGKDMPLEQNKAEVIYSQVRIQYRQAKNLLENARRQLSAAWNQKMPVFEKAQGQLEQMAEMPAFEQLAQQVWHNPDVARWEDEIERSRAQEKLEKANGKQDWTVSAGMQRFNESDDNAVVFGISIPLPVFDRNQGSIAAARFQTRKLQEQQKAARTQVHADLSQAYETMSNARVEAAETRDHILQNAKQAFEHAQEAYRQGKSDYLTVLDAQRTFFEAQTDYIQALAAFHRARADVQRLTGSLGGNVITNTNESVHSGE